MPQELHEQVPVDEGSADTAMGVLILTKAGYEADDILGNDRETLCGGGRGGFLSYQEIVICCSLQIRTLRFGCRVLRKVRRRYATITRRM